MGWFALCLFALLPACHRRVEATFSCWHDRLCADQPYCNSFEWIKPRCYNKPCYAETNKAQAMQNLDQALEGFKGQDYVLRQVKGLISLKLDNWDRPLNLHFAGDNGVGKTWLAKIISGALSTKPSTLFPGAGANFYQVDLQRYDALDQTASPSALKQARDDFLLQIREFLRICPRAVILVDELESLNPKVATALVPVLKGNPIGGVATKSATFILTSDFIKQGTARGLSREDARREVFAFSAAIYDDPTIAQYVIILPFDSMSLGTFQAIAAAKFRQLPCSMPQVKCVEWNDDAATVVAESAWSGLKERNGREVDGKFDSAVMVEVVAQSARTGNGKLIVTVTGDLARKKLAVDVRRLADESDRNEF